MQFWSRDSAADRECQQAGILLTISEHSAEIVIEYSECATRSERGNALQTCCETDWKWLIYLFYINNSEIIEMKSKMALGSKSKMSLKQGRMIFVLREG